MLPTIQTFLFNPKIDCSDSQTPARIEINSLIMISRSRVEIKACNPATQNIVLQTSIDREWKNTRGQHLAVHCVPWRQHFQFCISKTWNVWRSFCARRHRAVRKWSVEEEQQLSDAWPTHPHTRAREHTHTRTHTCPMHPALLPRYGDGKWVRLPTDAPCLPTVRSTTSSGVYKYTTLWVDFVYRQSWGESVSETRWCTQEIKKKDMSWICLPWR